MAIAEARKYIESKAPLREILADPEYNYYPRDLFKMLKKGTLPSNIGTCCGAALLNADFVWPGLFANTNIPKPEEYQAFGGYLSAKVLEHHIGRNDSYMAKIYRDRYGDDWGKKVYNLRDSTYMVHTLGRTHEEVVAKSGHSEEFLSEHKVHGTTFKGGDNIFSAVWVTTNRYGNDGPCENEGATVEFSGTVYEMYLAAFGDRLTTIKNPEYKRNKWGEPIYPYEIEQPGLQYNLWQGVKEHLKP